MVTYWTRRLVGALVVLALVFGGVAETVRPGRAAAQDEPLTIAFSIPGLNFPFFVHAERMVREAAEEMGNIEIITFDGQNDASKQVADLESAVTQEVDGVLVSPHSEAAAPGVEAVLEAGIPVVTWDRTVAAEGTLGHVGADNVRGGEIQGEYLLEILADGGKVLELTGTPGSSPAIDRDAGLKRALEGQDAVQIVAEQTGEFKRDIALTVTENLLTANPEPDAIVCANDDMAAGAAEAAEAAGLDVPIIGFDALPEALTAIQEGSMAATIEQFPGRQTAEGLTILVNKLRNDEDPTEHDTFLEPALITADNLGEAERAGEAGIDAATPTAADGDAPGGGEVAVSLTEFMIDMPTDLSAGPTSFEVTNDGAFPHGFEVEGQGVEAALEANLEPGQSATLEVDLGAGAYEIYCPVGTHADQGMRVELTVT